MDASPPVRGFEADEFETRCARANAAMTEARLDAIVVTSPHNVRYFTGFATEFWESPTRPWFVVVPRAGVPIAVIPEIGAPAMARTWIRDIRTWPAPQPADDGISLLGGVLGSLPRTYGRIGWEMGRESVIRMPIADFDQLRDRIRGLAFVDASPVIWSLRMVKSAGEVTRIRTACQLACDAFDVLPARLRTGDTEREAAAKFRIALAEAGVDAVPFLAVCSGEGGYEQIIVGSTAARLERGTVLFIDVGALWDGYSCDFDRNFAFGELADAALRTHDLVWRATEAGIAAARPGATTSDLWRAMAAVLETAGPLDLNVGRLGHGLGMQLTEPPSNTASDATPLVPGMVMTIEPGLEYAPGRMIVHEENVVITEEGCELLTRRAPREMPVISG